MAIRPRAICALVRLNRGKERRCFATKDGVTRLRGRWHKWRDIPLIVTTPPICCALSPKR
jgi:hypothetical protein